MYIGCTDCARPLSELKRRYERPRNKKADWNNTTHVCRKCQRKWLEKNPQFKKKK